MASVSVSAKTEDAAPGAPAAPAVIGNYRLEKTIGQGTYGKVKLAVDLRTNEKVSSYIIRDT